MDYEKQRTQMVETQLRQRGIYSEEVLEAFLEVPREEFIPKDLKSSAYQDNPLPIGEGQTISQPYMVALMTELAEPNEEATILDVGTGSGYQAAILSKLCSRVISVERIDALSKRAQATINKLGYKNVICVVGDGKNGYEEEAPYDGIIVAAAAVEIPPALIDQLKINGRLVIPIGSAWLQTLKIVTKTSTGIKVEDSVACSFVPLL